MFVTVVLSIANLAAFSYFLNYNSGYDECWAAVGPDYDNPYAYSCGGIGKDCCPLSDNCVNVSWDFRSVMGWGIFFSIWWLIMTTMPYCVKPCRKNINCCNSLAYFMSLLFLISVTVYRFRWAGDVCSGGKIDETEVTYHLEQENYFEEFSGYFLYWWTISAWCFVPIVCMWHCC